MFAIEFAFPLSPSHSSSSSVYVCGRLLSRCLAGFVYWLSALKFLAERVKVFGPNAFASSLAAITVSVALAGLLCKEIGAS